MFIYMSDSEELDDHIKKILWGMADDLRSHLKIECRVYWYNFLIRRWIECDYDIREWGDPEEQPPEPREDSLCDC